MEVIRIRPIDPSSRLTFERPGIELFDDRSHFILFKHINYIATAIKQEELNRLRMSPGYGTIFNATITKVTTKEIINRISFSFDDITYDDTGWRRIDIPCTADQFESSADYQIEIAPVSSDKHVLRKRFKLLKISKLPTKLYRPVEGDITFLNRNIKYLTAILKFQYEEPNCPEFPELTYRHISAGGKIHHGKAITKPCGNSEEKTINTEIILPLNDAPGDINYLGICCLGYEFAGTLFEISDKDYEKKLSCEQIVSLANYKLEEIINGYKRP